MKNLVPVLVLFLGCGEGGSGDDDDNGTVFPNIECPAEAGPLTLGRCETLTGDECDGRGEGSDIKEDTNIQFAPIGDTMSLVVGPQGYTMLVFMMRTQGIEAGMPERRHSPGNPRVQVTVRDDRTGDQLSDFREITPFEDDPESPGDLVTSFELWVVTATSVSFDLAGHRMTAQGKVSDAEGRINCGTASFEAIRDPRG